MGKMRILVRRDDMMKQKILLKITPRKDSPKTYNVKKITHILFVYWDVGVFSWYQT